MILHVLYLITVYVNTALALLATSADAWAVCGEIEWSVVLYLEILVICGGLIKLCWSVVICGDLRYLGRPHWRRHGVEVRAKTTGKCIMRNFGYVYFAEISMRNVPQIIRCKYSAGSLLSGNILFMWIFARFFRKKALKDSGVAR